MIRLIVLMRRQPQLSLEDFHIRWRSDHGPLVAGHQSRLGILRYSQSHRIDDSVKKRLTQVRGSPEASYDGVTEMWFASVEDLVNSLRQPAGTRAWNEILDDEAQFVDQARSPLWLAHEYPQFSSSLRLPVARPGSSIVKTHFTIRALPGLTYQEAQKYWVTSHGPTIRSMASTLGLLAYQQVHRFTSSVESEFQVRRETNVEPYLGHAEMWRDRSIEHRAPEAWESSRRATEDEERFLDFTRSSIWISKEHVFVEH